MGEGDEVQESGFKDAVCCAVSLIIMIDEEATIKSVVYRFTPQLFFFQVIKASIESKSDFLFTIRVSALSESLLYELSPTSEHVL